MLLKQWVFALYRCASLKKKRVAFKLKLLALRTSGISAGIWCKIKACVSGGSLSEPLSATQKCIVVIYNYSRWFTFSVCEKLRHVLWQFPFSLEWRVHSHPSTANSSMCSHECLYIHIYNWGKYWFCDEFLTRLFANLGGVYSHRGAGCMYPMLFAQEHNEFHSDSHRPNQNIDVGNEQILALVAHTQIHYLLFIFYQGWCKSKERLLFYYSSKI